MEELWQGVYFDKSIHQTKIEYCPTAADPEPYGGIRTYNLKTPPTKSASVNAGGTVVLKPEYFFYSPSIRVGNEDRTTQNEDEIDVLIKRALTGGSRKYVDIYVKNHLEKTAENIVIKLYVTTKRGLECSAMWNEIYTTEKKEYGLIPQVVQGEMGFLPVRFEVLLPDDRESYLIAQITSIDGTVNPKPDSMKQIDIRELMESYQWVILAPDKTEK